jgi:cobalamin synthase
VDSRTAPTEPGARGLPRLLSRRNPAASLYGTVLVTSVLAALEPAVERAREMLVTVGVTSLVFALSHAWAHALARSATTRAPADARGLLRGLRHEWPMAKAAGPALVALLLATLGIYSAKTGLWIAMGVNVVLLFVWGAALRQRAGGTNLQALGAGLASLALGLTLAGLKLLVH